MIKRMLFSSIICSAIVLASPQNLANISDLKESIALIIEKLNTLEDRVDNLTTVNTEQNNAENTKATSKTIKIQNEKNPEMDENMQEKAKKANQPISTSEIEEESKNLDAEDRSNISPSAIDAPQAIEQSDNEHNISENSNSPLLEQTSTEFVSKESFEHALAFLQKELELIKKTMEKNSQDFQELQSKLESNPQAQENTQSILQSNHADSTSKCSPACLSRTDFSSYKIEAARKNLMIQKEIENLRKYIDEIKNQLSKINAEYQGS